MRGSLLDRGDRASSSLFGRYENEQNRLGTLSNTGRAMVGQLPGRTGLDGSPRVLTSGGKFVIYVF